MPSNQTRCFHPDRPVGSEWKETALTRFPTWHQGRTPDATHQLDMIKNRTGWSSDDEAPSPRNPMLDNGETAADLLDASKTNKQRAAEPQTRGYISGQTKTNKGKAETVSDRIQLRRHTGAHKRQQEQKQRASVVVEGQRLHVRCDTSIATAQHATITRQADRDRFVMCSIRHSCRRKWRVVRTTCKSAL